VSLGCGQPIHLHSSWQTPRRAALPLFSRSITRKSTPAAIAGTAISGSLVIKMRITLAYSDIKRLVFYTDHSIGPGSRESRVLRGLWGKARKVGAVWRALLERNVSVEVDRGTFSGGSLVKALRLPFPVLRFRRETPVFFIIPLGAKAGYGDWSVVESNLSRTLSSVVGKEEGVHVFVVGHDRPAVDLLLHSQATFIQVSTPVPRSHSEKIADKHVKRRVAAARIRETLSQPAVFFCLDADDLVHHKLVSTLRRLRAGPGVIQGGWVLDLAAMLYSRRKNINKVCGSTMFATLRPGELPLDLNDTTALYSWLFEGPHAELKTRAMERGLRPLEVWKPLVVYVVNHTESLYNSQTGRLRTHTTKPLPISLEAAAEELRVNFGLDVAELPNPPSRGASG